MVYDTPTTLAEFTALIDLIQWPMDDCHAQLAFMKDLPNILEALRLGWVGLQPVRLYIAQATEPTLADWQQAWIDSGRALPISGTVFGLWDDTAGASAEYYWLDETMTLMAPYWWNGSSQFFDSIPADYTNTAALSTTEGGYIAQTLTLAADAYLVAEHTVTRGTDTTTTVQWRVSTDSANSTRGIIGPNGVSNAPRIMPFIYRSGVKHSAGALSFLFRTLSGTGTVLFTNTAVTRKIETGFYPYFLGEGSNYKTEAIYTT